MRGNEKLKTNINYLHVKSTTETFGVGTRKAIPVNLPFREGMTLPTAFAAPVAAGIIFWPAPRPSLQSYKNTRAMLNLKLKYQPSNKLYQSLTLPDGPSTVFWVAVVACTVVMRPSQIPNLSFITLASGAKQLVVHEALETTLAFGSYASKLTPQTYIGASALGAEIMTFLAPPLKWAWKSKNSKMKKIWKKISSFEWGMGKWSDKHAFSFWSIFQANCNLLHILLRYN